MNYDIFCDKSGRLWQLFLPDLAILKLPVITLCSDILLPKHFFVFVVYLTTLSQILS
jgi:hypothetical protein